MYIKDKLNKRIDDSFSIYKTELLVQVNDRIDVVDADYIIDWAWKELDILKGDFSRSPVIAEVVRALLP